MCYKDKIFMIINIINYCDIDKVSVVCLYLIVSYCIFFMYE